MRKAETIHACQECGRESLRWVGRCPECGAWGAMVERTLPSRSGPEAECVQPGSPVALTAVEVHAGPRLLTGIGEFDRVLGGGLVPGATVLVGGEPGIGKSTLLLQALRSLADRYGECLYVSAEESAAQVRLRADRLGCVSSAVSLLPETNVGVVDASLRALRPHAAVVDSVQALSLPAGPSLGGSPAQVREAAGVLVRTAKELDLPLFLVGHVTKEGSLAGPKVLEHLVDAVLYFEGVEHQTLRLLRAAKNRFGSTNEVGLFEMGDHGLSGIEEPSRVLLAQRPSWASGSVVVPTVEGSRALLAEVQALVSPSGYATPTRVTTGADRSRVSVVLAVLEKRAGLNLSASDVFINIAAGLRVVEPAADLGIAAALVSSQRDRPLPAGFAVYGEVGLSGEVRGTHRAAQRIAELARMGFSRCVMPAHDLAGECRRAAGEQLELVGVGALEEALANLFG
ncbi:MAG: DNA repair protein RadA [Armatimonadetes bacterium CG_4_10_14_3_um_filter_66_18]|nr:DNA repair protein RadA [Armatimonadota bacterium]OIO92258.1 MAG: DNA repair protein RadA [Armatimonadetes bacterium CG2_30_66_41]PIU93056.1 MAG: DNA repair protein RadA [Armatimonadetes bacterium CG06_land_8_20_14_3_00_66_21]PIX37923.1 MAG: DNA repair protein RadA [Armatimonadetes bacterium CG_4_8_14_3_um_filter_66_20]PIY49285.1 MAG: DNA repair protein RadA [Armatimonadetes bacterium CG_4_10_14_3_um_filter_66_18]PIZ37448.1 MAG: DNA repair protein RadA [Armatimonadetes bacterium CG_4_10_14_